MFRESRLPIIMMDCTKLPVLLSDWLALTDTSDKIAADISKCFTDEIENGFLTGFYPYKENGEIYFLQRWLMIIGEKAL